MLTVLFVVWSLASMAPAPPDAEIAFTIDERDVIPEGVAYDPFDDAFYVSSTYRRKIVRVSAGGDVEDFVTEKQHGLWGVVGMTVDAERRLLWAASSHAGDGMPMVDMPTEEEGNAGLFAFHLDTGELAHRILLTEASHFLNDVALTSTGDVLVTDSRTRVVYQTRLGDRGASTLVPFVELADLGSPNGITLSDDGREAFVAVGSDVAVVQMDTRAVRLVSRPAHNRGVIDGLYFFEGSLIAMQPFVDGAHVARLVLDSSREAVVDVQPLVAHHEALDQPTTGVIVGDELCFIANSHLQTFRRVLEAATPDIASASLTGPIVLRVSID